MKLITSSKDLQKEFLRLLNQYNEYFWAVAWAGKNFLPLTELLNNKNKIGKIVVGLHFYQTNPDFIEKFINNEKVRFIEQTDGVFHPKVYCFMNNEEDWEILIGSANFTHAAFNLNQEATVLITSNDDCSNAVLKNAQKVVNEGWKKGVSFSKSMLIDYARTWHQHRTKINRLASNYNETNDKSLPIYKSETTKMNWSDFYNRIINNESKSQIDTRLEVLNISNQLFNKERDFNNLNVHERKFISGLPNKLNNIDNGYFGKMGGNGKFHHSINVGDEYISKAINCIPLTGVVNEDNYQDFASYFRKGFSENNNYLSTATRLLCIKRPDVFICLSSNNTRLFCKDFLINRKALTLDNYYNSVILRIQDSNWWNAPRPSQKLQGEIWDSRAAFLDSIYYNRG